MQDRVWREGATAEEIAAVADIDKAMAESAEYRATLANRRQRITNRACQRARYNRRRTEALAAMPK